MIDEYNWSRFLFCCQVIEITHQNNNESSQLMIMMIKKRRNKNRRNKEQDPKLWASPLFELKYNFSTLSNELKSQAC